MLPILEKLAILQDRDGRILSLRREFDALPVRREQAAARLKEADQRHADSHQRQMHAQSAIRQAELDIEGAKEKINRLRRQQFEIKSNEQYKTLQGEIDAEILHVRTIEDREIELMEGAEKAQSEVTSQTAALAETRKSVEAELRDLEARSLQLREEITRAEEERKRSAEGIEPQWLDRYVRLFARYGAQSIVSLDREICSGCHMKLPPQIAQDAKREQAVCACTFCGRMLYWKG